MPKIKYICQQCKKEFYKHPSQRRQKRVFCSKECYWKFKKTISGKDHPSYKKQAKRKEKTYCLNCNKLLILIVKFPSELRNKNKRKFCSTDCAHEYNINKRFSKIKKRICVVCDREIARRKWKLNRSTKGWRWEGLATYKKRKYCSNKCQYKANSGKGNWNWKSKKTGICLNCGKKFSYYPSYNFRKQKKYCSKKCMYKYKGRFNIACIQCNKKFHAPPSRIKNYKKLFCSIRCMGLFRKGKKFTKEHLINLKNGIHNHFKNYKEPTKPEKQMHQKLENWNINFIPQHLMHNKFIVDFYLPKQDIVLEVDGRYWHNLEKQKKKDKARNAYLTACGHKVIRVWEDEIENFSL